MTSAAGPWQSPEIAGRQEVELKVELSFPRNGLHGDRAELRVRDTLSGEVLAEIPMTPEQFMELMSNSPVRVQSFVPDEARVARLFRQREQGATKVPAAILRDVDNRDAAIGLWADKIAARDGWDSYRVDEVRGGPQVVFMRWAR